MQQEEQEQVQALRSVNKSQPPFSLAPANADDNIYVEYQIEPDTQKTFLLWDDVLQAFEDVVHV